MFESQVSFTRCNTRDPRLGLGFVGLSLGCGYECMSASITSGSAGFAHFSLLALTCVHMNDLPYMKRMYSPHLARVYSSVECIQSSFTLRSTAEDSVHSAACDRLLARAAGVPALGWGPGASGESGLERRRGAPRRHQTHRVDGR